jgi:hypothetical protein
VLCAACSGAVHTLETDLAALRASIEQGQYEQAFDGLSADQKQGQDAAQFAAALEADPALVSELLELLAKAADNPEIEYRARLTLADGTQVVMLMVEGKWVFETPVTHFYGQSTPRETLASFIAAFEAGRFDVLALLVPSSYATTDDASVLEKAWTDPAGKEEIERIVKVLSVHLDDEIVIQANRATLAYPEGQVTFLREGGLWVILDLE